MADWLKIKAEYISGCGSMRELAEKHGVSLDAIKRRSASEKWSNERTKTAPKIHQKTVRKVAERTADREADRIARLLAIGDKLAEKLDRAADELDRQTAKRVVKTKEVEYGEATATGKPTREVIREDTDIVTVTDLPIDRMGLKQLASALKDLRDVAGTVKQDDESVRAVAALMARMDEEAQHGAEHDAAGVSAASDAPLEH